MYHGAALTQVAEHPQFTAINAFQHKSNTSRCGFVINNDIGIYIKYATKKRKPFDEFVFTFTKDHIVELNALIQKAGKAFIVFVCVEAEEICCISQREFKDLIAARRAKCGHDEDAYAVLVTVQPGKSCRVYMNVPGAKKISLGEKTVARNRFPNAIFQQYGRDTTKTGQQD